MSSQLDHDILDHSKRRNSLHLFIGPYINCTRAVNIFHKIPNIRNQVSANIREVKTKFYFFWHREFDIWLPNYSRCFYSFDHQIEAVELNYIREDEVVSVRKSTPYIVICNLYGSNNVQVKWGLVSLPKFFAIQP